jgi:antitoxin ParD1/3/4
MATMNISLPDPLKAWVEAQAESGRSSNASDYVRDLIRKDQDERAQKHDALQRMITESMKSGEAKSLDMAAFKKRMRGAHGKKSR